MAVPATEDDGPHLRSPLPNTWCAAPFSHVVFFTVMKNCEPFVSAPALAIESQPLGSNVVLSCTVVECRLCGQWTMREQWITTSRHSELRVKEEDWRRARTGAVVLEKLWSPRWRIWRRRCSRRRCRRRAWSRHPESWTRGSRGGTCCLCSSVPCRSLRL